MTEKYLILGGTREAVELAATLAASGKDVTTSLAGRTNQPLPVPGKLRTGGFGGAAGLAKYLRDGEFTCLIDATHPFATVISHNAVQAAELAGIPIRTCTRPPWEAVSGDCWIECDSLAQACDAIPAGSRVFLALGSQYVDDFRMRNDVYFLVRQIDPPTLPLRLPDHEVVLGRPGTLDDEERLMKEYAITHLLCRNAGGTGGYAKIAAARALSLPVILVRRPKTAPR